MHPLFTNFLMRQSVVVAASHISSLLPYVCRGRGYSRARWLLLCYETPGLLYDWRAQVRSPVFHCRSGDELQMQAGSGRSGNSSPGSVVHGLWRWWWFACCVLEEKIELQGGFLGCFGRCVLLWVVSVLVLG